MIKKCLFIALALGLLMSVPMHVSAAQGSLQIKTDAETVSLYRVASPEGRGYRLKENCGGGYLTFDDTLSPDLAVWLHSHVREEETVTVQGENATFSNLEEGLYLVWSEDGFSPFLVSIPWDGYHWELEVDPSSEPVPQTGDPVAIALFVMSASGAGVLVLGRHRKRY